MEIPTSDPELDNQKEVTEDASPDVLPIKSLPEVAPVTNNDEGFAGDTSLIAKDKISPNFVQGSTGWRLGSNGCAEFNCVTLNDATNQTTFQTAEDITITTPLAVTSSTDDYFSLSSGLDNASFVGFLTATTTVQGQQVLGYETQTTDLNTTDWTYTAQAGVDRAIFLFIDKAAGTVSTVEWNGISGTLVESRSNTTWAYLWVIPIGSSAVDQDAVLGIWESSSSTADSAIAMTISNVNQADPFGAAGKSTTNSPSITQEDAYGITLLGHSATTTPTISDTRMTVYTVEDICFGWAKRGGINSKQYTTTGSTDIRNIICSVKPNKYADIKLICSGIVGGFTGLTVGSTYYLSDTRGAISTTPGSTSVTVGKAITTTQILIT